MRVSLAYELYFLNVKMVHTWTAATPPRTHAARSLQPASILHLHMTLRHSLHLRKAVPSASECWRANEWPTASRWFVSSLWLMPLTYVRTYAVFADAHQMLRALSCDCFLVLDFVIRVSHPLLAKKLCRLQVISIFILHSFEVWFVQRTAQNVGTMQRKPDVVLLRLHHWRTVHQVSLFLHRCLLPLY